MNVELLEGSDHFIIDIKWQFLIELVWGHPRDVLTHNLNLVVNPFDAEKRFLEGLRDGAVGHPLFVQSVRHLNVFRFYF